MLVMAVVADQLAVTLVTTVSDGAVTSMPWIVQVTPTEFSTFFWVTRRLMLLPVRFTKLTTTSSGPLHAVLAAAYEGERFIRVLPLRDAATLEEGFYDVQACNDSNRVDILVLGNERHAMVMARLDNLGKGASGAAVQCMNLHLGCDEGLGL